MIGRRATVKAGLLAPLVIRRASAQNTANHTTTTIRAQLANGRFKQGTGFFIGRQEIVTSYHVIMEATRIEALDMGGESLRIIALDPASDLALLHAPKAAAVAWPLAPKDLDLAGKAVYVFGSMLAARGLRFKIDLLDTVPRRVQEILDPLREQRPIAKLDSTLKVLLFQGFSYNTVSGSPLITADNLVIGVMCGSFAQGGSVGWAIPVEYVETLRRSAPIDPSQVRDWPPGPFAEGTLAGVYINVVPADGAATRLLRLMNELLEINTRIASRHAGHAQTARELRLRLQSLDTVLNSLPPGGEASFRQMMDLMLQTLLPAGSPSLSPVFSAVRDDLARRYELDRVLREALLALLPTEGSATPPGRPGATAALRRAFENNALTIVDTYEGLQKVDQSALLRSLTVVGRLNVGEIRSKEYRREMLDHLEVVHRELSKYSADSDRAAFPQWMNRERKLYEDSATALATLGSLTVAVPSGL